MRKGSKHSRATLRKLRLSHLGKKQSPELIEKRVASLRGRKRPQWVRDKISRGRKGMTFTAEHRRNISLASAGRVVSKATRKKLSRAGKGRTVKKSTRQKIRRALRGVPHVPQRRRNQSEAHIGLANPNCRGPRSPNWIDGRSLSKRRGSYGQNEVWRLAVYKRDGYACQHCGKAGNRDYGIHGIGLDTAHIKSYQSYPKLRFVINNGITLCRTCHRKFDKENKNG